mmetsp:Transcript_10561/g.20334  ORF Transcript_10561/g.20334 Transcript_10561/m.20334 type:complete len:189 (+) Transcript_10561:2950-3516(+)|eukprot:CAMPEP_0204919234 /NCGR_PEP_ID=MMETSP1397-20131031/16711_1 /ASSEMBLY_ACC=CAM_ASM_000891 /TAXON_ID=49980 /ORGANISM="Climacostomum Climacostomum virens, Strain Stock W-24" /LENGTH=188 /DNA_ID=CAMNT_0052092813 /DNA_START=6 /DNA_END=572 /DNA_ORIENTATION=+
MQVNLNVYDLTPYNFYSAWAGIGAFHSGLEVDGAEYSFGAIIDGGSGVYSIVPKTEHGLILRETILLGIIHCSRRELQRVIADISAEFEASEYDILRRNCNDFCNALCLRLLGKSIPGYINRAAKVGKCFSCLLPASLRGKSDDSTKLLAPPQVDYSLISTSEDCHYKSKDKRQLLAEAAQARLSKEV